MLMSRFGEADRRGHEALAVARAVGARVEEGHVLCTLGCCRAALGDHEGGIEIEREAVAIAEELADPDALDRAYANLGHLLLESGRLHEAAGLVFDNSVPGDDIWGVRQNGAAANSVEALIRLGRYEDAETLLVRSGDRGVGSCITAPSLLRAMVVIRRGRLEEAARALVIADEVTGRLTDVQCRGAFHVRRAELALVNGRPAEAYAHIERALALAAGTDDETVRPEMYALAVRALADQCEDARARGRRFDADKARLLALGFQQEARRLVTGHASTADGAHSAPAFAVTCGPSSRLEDPIPSSGPAARAWGETGEPHPATYAARLAEALLERRACGAATACAGVGAPAWSSGAPIAGADRRLAQRARIPLPDDAGTAASAAESTVAADLASHHGCSASWPPVAPSRDRRSALHQQRRSACVSACCGSSTSRIDEAGRIDQAHGG
jgi:tetratricopeptide (TPR) repeat protein